MMIKMSQFNDGYIELIKLKAEALDTETCDMGNKKTID